MLQRIGTQEGSTSFGALRSLGEELQSRLRRDGRLVCVSGFTSRLGTTVGGKQTA